MQQIVAEILFQGQEKPATVGDMSPWVDLRVPPPEVLEGIVEGQTWRRFLKTHLPADAFLPYYQPTNKYIYVARDGRDAFMSLLNHYEKGNDAWYGALNMSPGLVGDPLPFWSDVGGDPAALFDKWMTEGWHTLPDETDGWPFWSYFKNVKTWWSLANNFGAENIYFVHFNNMKKDLDGEMRKIAQFLGVPVNEDVWSECVLGCTFEEMQKNADTVAPLNGALWEGGGKSFIFKGTNERWREVLSEEQVAAYEAKAVEELGAECAEFMATGMLPGIA
jgi:aryl sulfotransferase